MAVAASVAASVAMPADGRGASRGGRLVTHFPGGLKSRREDTDEKCIFARFARFSAQELL